MKNKHSCVTWASNGKNCLLAGFSFLNSERVVSLHRIHRDHLHHHGDRHSYESDGDAGHPLREAERGRVGEAAEELYDYELEDDGAAEDHGEHVVV